MPHPVPFINLDAKWLSDLAEDFAVSAATGELAASNDLAETIRRLRRVAQNLESLDSKVRHRPQKSED